MERRRRRRGFDALGQLLERQPINEERSNNHIDDLTMDVCACMRMCVCACA